MRFEKFLLDDYLQTKEGKELFAFFKNFRKNFFHNQKKFFEIVNSFLEIPDAEYFYSLNDPPDGYIITETEILRNIREFSGIDDFIGKGCSLELWESDPRLFQNCICFYSVIYYIKYPEYAFPYLFPEHFFRLPEICEKFEIAIPPVPGKTKHLERIYYYFNLCRVMYEFRKQYGLSPVELCVFLYGFAPRFSEKYTENELPQPNNIHIIGTAKEDVEEYTKNPFNEKSVYCWQGPEGILPGDIIILYERAPYSRISSIWRAVSPSYDDPFHYYPGKVFMSCPVRVPNIEFDTLFSDPIWGKNGLVKAHMQGIGFKRTIITHDEYERLKKLFKQRDKKFNLKSLPEPPPYAQFYHEGIKTEKDVEEKFLEPLLAKLGYNVKKEFTRQFPIRMGRGIRYYPDYALHAKGTRGEERADFIWEAKYRIPTQKQLREDYGQAKSYAIRLQTKGFGLVSIEGVKIWTAASHFDFDKLISCSWEELEMPEKMGQLKILFNGLCKPKNLRQ